MLCKIFLSEFLLLFALNAFSQCIHCLRERLLQQKSKEKPFYISKACAFGHKNILSPEGTQAIKIRWGKNCYPQSGSAFVDPVTHPASLPLHLWFIELHKFVQTAEREEKHSISLEIQEQRRRYVDTPGKEARRESFLMPGRRMSEMSKWCVQATQNNRTYPNSPQSNLGKGRMISPGPESSVELLKVMLTWRLNTESNEY